MGKAKRVITAPRIEVVLDPETPDNINTSSARFHIWLVLHVHDGKDPETVRLPGGPFDRGDATVKLSEIWVEISERYSEV